MRKKIATLLLIISFLFTSNIPSNACEQYDKFSSKYDECVFDRALTIYFVSAGVLVVGMTVAGVILIKNGLSEDTYYPNDKINFQPTFNPENQETGLRFNYQW